MSVLCSSSSSPLSSGRSISSSVRHSRASHRIAKGEDNDTKFDKAGFLASLPADRRSFAEQFVQSQLFEGMIMVMARLDEPKDEDGASESKRVIRLMKKCAALLEEGEEKPESVEKIRTMLQPQGWKLKEVRLPEMRGSGEDEE